MSDGCQHLFKGQSRQAKLSVEQGCWIVWAQVEGGRAVPFSDGMVLCVCKLGYCCINLSHLPQCSMAPFTSELGKLGPRDMVHICSPQHSRGRGRGLESAGSWAVEWHPIAKEKKYNKNNTLEKAGKVAWSSFYYSEGSFVMSDKKFPPAGYCPPLHAHPFPFPSPASSFILFRKCSVWVISLTMILPSASRGESYLCLFF